ncbi:hypothetical protein N0B31_20975 [Salinirubellus salinus]|uniref:Uncharacterized protein n=1 Tax=Salinirubellus salinus TaxID=1364945 RepID=A0A9E7R345_9EURY|nr:hypothetical protein [Salinirubellus salinus]UWM54583.1 hypothetical protein N0B31_20975 [Salinirubellus salinus]
MSLGSALSELGRFLDACRADGTVSSVELSGGESDDGSRTLTAEVVLTASLTGGDGATTLSLGAASVDADGTLRLGLETTGPVLPVDEYDVDVVSATGTVTDDASVTVEALVAVPAEEGTGTAAESERTETAVLTAGGEAERTQDTEDVDEESATEREASEPPARRDRDVPPFRDRELLAEVYETHDTFAEMTEALGMDVTAETVRRYMVDHGIHQPNSYDTGGDDEERSESDQTAEAESVTDPEPDADPEPSPPVVADGIGLPDDVTVERLIETVKRSNTIYEVRQDIGIEHDDALEMLRELNLLDLVVGRLATEAERDISRDEIVGRLRAASTAQ